MVYLTKANLICMSCGFELHQISTFWLRRNPQFKCPACNSTTSWKRIQHAAGGAINKDIEKVRDGEFWKKLIIAQNPQMFHRGTWKLTKNWKKYNEWIEQQIEDAGNDKVKLAAINNFRVKNEKFARIAQKTE